MTENTQGPGLALSKVDIDLILRAVGVYDQHVAILKSGASSISKDDLADMNNDCEYMKGLRRMLEGPLSQSR